MEGDKEKALEAGCAGYITKPIDTRNFLETLSQYFKNDDHYEKSRGNEI
jgi:CheY-like chemotaxis protein